MVGKVVVSGISLILVVGVALAVVAMVTKNNNSDVDLSSPKMKAVSTICSTTDYQQECQNTLTNVAQNASVDDPKEYAKAAVLATIQEITKGYNLTADLMVEAANNASIKMSVDDCKDLLQSAIDELHASYSTVGDPDLHTNEDRVADIKNWLTAVISYQQSCLDGLEEFDPQLKQKMQDGLDVAGKLTSNALAIVGAVSDILKNFGLQLKVQPSGRRLLETTEIGSDGFPTWMSGADRKLLASRGGGARVKPNAVVAKDGSGQYKSIGAALAAYPKALRGRYVIYVKAGIYDEYITVTKDMKNVFMYGDGPRKTIVTGRKNNRDGITTQNTASFSAIGEGFLCKSMGFRNTAGPEGHQAVALRVQSDRSAFYNCRMDGYQDTLYVQTHRQFYRNCVISGTVDFIFGDSSTIIQNSLIIVRRPMDNQKNTVTANGRADKKEISGLVIHNCRIVPEQKLFAERFKIPTFLGRPWKQYARTVIMETTLGDFIQPDGYMPWSGNFALETCSYFEYGNRGPGANTNRRVRWKGVRVIGRNEALQYTAGPFLMGRAWLPATGGPYLLGLKH
ncbi:LOW QUALITY PROTEIN: pectinesterase-like [Benincasa hispida]|uniref:LOW QUALITY PROTEIN: pectinesterase-like n=1 Tax=Benincasa hispida TaxID=102211 RepID=UPI001900CAE7|nr:LOW QUALITY PROTEIN: pectinesterase-like [Benincasa hispida]